MAEGANRSHMLRNRMLAVLSPAELALLQLERVDLQRDQVLLSVGQQLPYYYFMATALVSMVTTMLDGRSAETNNVGSDSVVGISAVYLGGVAIADYVVAIPGVGFRTTPEHFRTLYDSSALFRELNRRMMILALRMANRNYACQRLHDEMQRTCRWLVKA